MATSWVSDPFVARRHSRHITNPITPRVTVTRVTPMPMPKSTLGVNIMVNVSIMVKVKVRFIVKVVRPIRVTVRF